MTQEKPSKNAEQNEHWRGSLVSGIILDDQHTTFVDTIHLDALLKFHWSAVRSRKCWYAKSTVGQGKFKLHLSMHRLIANTPRGHVCHHRNRCSLDNRFNNLLNMTKDDHHVLHRDNHALIKFETNSRPLAELCL